LWRAGYEVISISRGIRAPYFPHHAWDEVQSIKVDRFAEERAGTFGPCIRTLDADVVIDLTCYTPESAKELVEAIRGRTKMFLHCGTIWVHGHSSVVPTTEKQSRRPICDYGKRKLEIENYLLGEAQANHFPAAILHPGHIVGKGWPPLNPAGHFHPRVFEQLARGEELALPNLGMETVHHVHADDVAQGFERVLSHRENAIGNSFHIVAARAMTLRGYAEAVAEWSGREARLCFLPWSEWRNTVSETEAKSTWDHISHSPHCSISKARRLLGFEPRYTSLDAVRESVQSL
jgi:nucleoside-diphosphate-sugar epimerase